MSVRRQGPKGFQTLSIGLILLCFIDHGVAQPLTMCGGGSGGLPTPWTRSDGDLFFPDGRVGIGEVNPDYRLSVDGGFNAESVSVAGEPVSTHVISKLRFLPAPDALTAEEGTYVFADPPVQAIEQVLPNGTILYSEPRLVNGASTDAWPDERHFFGEFIEDSPAVKSWTNATEDLLKISLRIAYRCPRPTGAWLVVIGSDGEKRYKAFLGPSKGTITAIISSCPSFAAARGITCDADGYISHDVFSFRPSGVSAEIHYGEFRFDDWPGVQWGRSTVDFFLNPGERFYLEKWAGAIGGEGANLGCRREVASGNYDPTRLLPPALRPDYQHGFWDIPVISVSRVVSAE